MPTQSFWTAAELRESFGVNCHFERSDLPPYTNSAAVIDKLVKLGTRHLRCDLLTHNSTWYTDHYHEILHDLADQGVKFTFLLGRPEGVGPPPEDRADWYGTPAELIPIAASEYYTSVAAFEGPNEPDNSQVNGGADYPDWQVWTQDQMDLIDAEMPDHAVFDNTPVLGPSVIFGGSPATCGEIPADVKNTHPYTGNHHPTVSAIEDQYTYADPMYAAANPPMWITEYGYTVVVGGIPGAGWPEISEAQQAILTVRQWLTHALAGVERSFYYDFMDDGNDGTWPNMFGLIRYDLTERPAYLAVQRALALLPGGVPASPAARGFTKASGPTSVKLLEALRADEDRVLFVWREEALGQSNSSTTINVLDATQVQLHNLETGEVTELTITSDQVTFNLGDWPVALRLVMPKSTSRRVFFLDPNATLKNLNNWWVRQGGAGSDHETVAKATRAPLTPSTSTYLEATTNGASLRFSLTSDTLNAGESIDYVRVWFYGDAQQYHFYTLRAYYGDGGTLTQFVGSNDSGNAVTGPQSAGWYKSRKITPRKQAATYYAHMTGADIPGFAVEVILGETQAQAANSKLYQVYLEVGVSKMERLVSTQGPKLKGNITGKTFTPFGLQLAGPRRYFEEWWLDEARAELRKIKTYGANTIRLHVPMKAILSGPSTVNQVGLDTLDAFLTECQDENLRVILTGNNLYLPVDRPSWIDALSEADRWTAMAFCWNAMTRVTCGHPCVIVLDLINEPLVPNPTTASYYAGSLEGFDFAAYLSKDLAGRTRTECISQYLDQMNAQIRPVDPVVPISWGLMAFQGFIPGSTDPFVGDTNLAKINLMMPHLYPGKGQLKLAIDTLAGYQRRDPNKPVILEESGNFGGLATSDTIELWTETARRFGGALGGFLDPEDPVETETNATQTRAFRQAAAEGNKRPLQTERIASRSGRRSGQRFR